MGFTRQGTGFLNGGFGGKIGGVIEAEYNSGHNKLVITAGDYNNLLKQK